MPRSLKTIDALAAAGLKKDGALMVDVREPGEYARVRIPGSQNIALSRFEGAALPVGPGQAVVFFCASGNRTAANAARLAAKAGDCEAYVMQGGIASWETAGLPIESGQLAEDSVRSGFFSRLFG